MDKTKPINSIIKPPFRYFIDIIYENRKSRACTTLLLPSADAHELD